MSKHFNEIFIILVIYKLSSFVYNKTTLNLIKMYATIKVLFVIMLFVTTRILKFNQ